jgi:branched-chain amino acid transport system ATP-binding protein
VSDPLLELRSVRAGYGRIEVLHGLDLVVPERSVVAVLGPNGAGKTTTLRVASGLLPPTSGEVLLAGRRVNGVGADALARIGVCSVPEGRGVFPNLTVRENLWLATYAGVSLDDVEERAYARFPRLAERRGQLAGTLSGGEQQMLALARGLATEPAVLMIDELSMGLAPLVVEELYGEVAGVARAGVSVVVVEQFAELVLDIADRAVLVLNGTVAHDGAPAEVRDRLGEVYLGSSA